MIGKITIRDFKSYRQAELKLSPLTVLVGANASGKSNALEAIRFLNWMAQGHKLSSLQYMVNENDQVVRGRVADLPRRGAKEFGLGCTLSPFKGKIVFLKKHDGLYNTLELSLGLRENDELHIESETVYAPEQEGYNTLYRTIEPSKGVNTQISVEYNNFARGGKKPQVSCTDQMAVFLQLESAARFADGHKEAKQSIPRVAKRFEDHLAGILFLDPVPQKMRDYSFLSEKKLQGDGSNLSAVLYHLWNSEDEKEKNRNTLLEFIQSLPEQSIAGIDFLEGPRGEVMIQLKETFGGEEHYCDAGLLSDGTLRVLALAAALLSAEPGNLVVIEEVDNGVHPSRMGKLLQSINNIAKEKQLAVLISSHNPALLDALPDEAVPDVVFCYRNPQTGWSELARMEDFTDYPELTAQGALGELLTKGLIDRFVKHHPGSEEKKRKALKWLESIK
ncbi:MAG: AAA family ATPase [Lewinellaceae bacterium]|nr:AAA family ATPase [Lewinellaceae bacterium]